jgi:hypothetical protein
MKIKVSQLQQGDVFRHPNFNFNLTVSDAFEPNEAIQTTNMHPKTGEHIYFTCGELDHEVTLISYANPVYGRKHALICEETQSGDDGHTPIQ